MKAVWGVYRAQRAPWRRYPVELLRSPHRLWVLYPGRRGLNTTKDTPNHLPCAAVEIQNALAVCRLLCVWALPTARTDNAMHASKNHTQATDTGARRL